MAIRESVEAQGEGQAETVGKKLEIYNVLRRRIDGILAANPSLGLQFAQQIGGLDEIEQGARAAENLLVVTALLDAARGLFRVVREAEREFTKSIELFGRLKRMIEEKRGEIERLSLGGEVSSELVSVDLDLEVAKGRLEEDPELAVTEIRDLFSRISELYSRVRLVSRDTIVETVSRNERDLRPDEAKGRMIVDKTLLRGGIEVVMQEKHWLEIPADEARRNINDGDPSGCVGKYCVVLAIDDPAGGSPIYFSKSFGEVGKVPTAVPDGYAGSIYAFANRKLIDAGNDDACPEQVRESLCPLELSSAEGGVPTWSFKTSVRVLGQESLRFHELGFSPVNPVVVSRWIMNMKVDMPCKGFLVLYVIKIGKGQSYCFCKFVNSEKEIPSVGGSTDVIGPNVFSIHPCFDMVGGRERVENRLKKFPVDENRESPKEAAVRELETKLRADSWIHTSENLSGFWEAQRETDVKSGYLNVIKITVPDLEDPICFSVSSDMPLVKPNLGDRFEVQASWYHITPRVTGAGKIIDCLIPLEFSGSDIQYISDNKSRPEEPLMNEAKYMRAGEGSFDAWAKEGVFPYSTEKFWFAFVQSCGENEPAEMYFSVWQRSDAVSLPDGLCGKILEYDVKRGDDGKYSLDVQSGKSVFCRERTEVVEAIDGEATVPDDVPSVVAVASAEPVAEPAAVAEPEVATAAASTAMSSVTARLGFFARRLSSRMVAGIAAGVAAAALFTVGVGMNLRRSAGEAGEAGAGTLAALAADSGAGNIRIIPGAPVFRYEEPSPGEQAESVEHVVLTIGPGEGIERALRRGLAERIDPNEVREAVRNYVIYLYGRGEPLPNLVHAGQRLDVDYWWNTMGNAGRNLVIDGVELKKAAAAEPVAEPVEAAAAEPSVESPAAAPSTGISSAPPEPGLSDSDLRILQDSPGKTVLYTPNAKKNQQFAPEPRPYVVVGPSGDNPAGLILRDPASKRQFAISADRAKRAIKLVKQPERAESIAILPLKNGQDRIYFAEKDGGIQNLLMNYFLDAKGFDKPFAILQAKKMLAKARNIPDLKLGGDGKPVAIYKTLWNLNLMHVGDSIVVEEVDGEYHIVALDKQWPNKLKI